MKTPFFIVRESELEKNILKLENALKQYWNRYIIGYSLKTNALPYLLTYMRKRGIYAEVVSEDEFCMAQKMKYEERQIIYNGPVKGKQSFLRGIMNGAVVNIDSNQELLWLRELDTPGEYRVGIRVNFDLEQACPGETSSGKEGSRFGFCYENGELKTAIDKLREMKNIRIVGLHLHNSTKTRSIKVYREISKMACKVAKEFSFDLSYIDIGGGFFGGMENKPQFDEYIRVISGELKKYFSCSGVTLIVEPGTSLVSSPIDFVTSVLDIKRMVNGNVIVTDGSRMNVDPLMKKSGYFSEIEYVDPAERTSVFRQIISGFTCMEADRLFELKNEKEIRTGDRIVYKKVGAYTMCLNPLFIQYFPAVYWKNDRGIFCARRAWTEENCIQNTIWEDEQIEYLDFELRNSE